MQCPELRERLRPLCDLGETPPPELCILVDDGEVKIQALADHVLVQVALEVPGANDAALEAALRLGQPSLARFPGTLAQTPDNRLWLLAQPSRGGPVDAVLETLEALLNQRDTWQSMLAQTRRPMPPPTPRLAPKLSFATGTRHA